MKRINLGISGCMGRMGQQLIKSSKKNKNFKLVALTENRANNKYFKKITNSKDFYSRSNLRDLLFHVQEHQFTISEIREIIENYKLEFLNFILTDPLIKLKYLKNFPNDIMQNSLNNWEKFENDNPNIFNGMYQFWLKKINS